MKKILQITFASLLLSQSAVALLPPLWQGVLEIKAILSDEHLKDYLDSAEVIESIVKNPTGYIIKTNYSELEAKVVALPQNKPGPAKFEVQFYNLTFSKISKN